MSSEHEKIHHLRDAEQPFGEATASIIVTIAKETRLSAQNNVSQEEVFNV